VQGFAAWHSTVALYRALPSVIVRFANRSRASGQKGNPVQDNFSGFGNTPRNPKTARGSPVIARRGGILPPVTAHNDK
jgi:hypothetical protein